MDKTIEMLFIPEGDIYRLAARSELPGAKEFESWIFDEVLLSIRRHGAYMTPETIEQAILSPDFIIQLAQKLKEEMALRKEMISFLIDNKYLYRSPSGKLLPHGGRPNELFDVKEANDKKRGWFGVQTFVTPRGRETLRLLLTGKPESGIWGKPHIYPSIPAGDIPDMTEGEAYRLEAHYKRKARKPRR